MTVRAEPPAASVDAASAKAAVFSVTMRCASARAGGPPAAIFISLRPTTRCTARPTSAASNVHSTQALNILLSDREIREDAHYLDRVRALPRQCGLMNRSSARRVGLRRAGETGCGARSDTHRGLEAVP